MAAFQLNPGENLLFQFYLFSLEEGQSWEGEWDDATAYVIDDVVIHEHIAYVAVAGSTNDEPPSASWQAIPVVAASDIKEVIAELRPNATEDVSVMWKYKSNQPPPSNVKLENGLLQLELLKKDSETLSGSYDIALRISAKAALYIESGAQTDVSVLPDVLQVGPAPV